MAHAPRLPPATRAATVPPGNVIEIDGSLLEGGGQILRNASALSAILQLPIRVDKIRAGRSKPGLRPQHLAGLQLIAALSGGTLQGGDIGSSCIGLQPGKLVCSHQLADTKTAGSCMLLVQSALPCMLYAASGAAAAVSPAEAGGGGGGDSIQPGDSIASPASRSVEAAQGTVADTSSWSREAAAATKGLPPSISQLDLRGGTDAAMAPPAGYVLHVLLPLLRRLLGIYAELELVRRGFFPKGQGQVVLTVQPLQPGAHLPAIDMTERGAITSIAIRAFSAGKIAPAVAQRLAAAAHKEIQANMQRCGLLSAEVPVSLEVVHEPAERAFGDGCGLLVTATSSTGCLLGASGLGERGVPAEAIGQRAGCELMDVVASGACVDGWLQDQLVVFMALAQGRSQLLTGEPTLHTRTACTVAEALTGARFSIAAQNGSTGLWVLACDGAGVAAPEVAQAGASTL
ncbi:hypothetical protein D9Q98_002340 [Chlorella vulgaris]|uniref:RNA 3'-terminal-phosphate cyclase (ATP) n=1 Tax=Chlorella vulgaris TaxID=3077 RepID=A0A9D4TWC4_CHLVU|nr:hypothetical protein D9Q98_002340 [Chlorella vulgaris]